MLPDGALQSQLRITFLGESLTAISPPFQYGIILTHGPSPGLRTGCLHNYVHDVAAVSPNLCLSSPEKRCGKTRNLPASLFLRSRPASAWAHCATAEDDLTRLGHVSNHAAHPCQSLPSGRHRSEAGGRSTGPRTRCES